MKITDIKAAELGARHVEMGALLVRLAEAMDAPRLTVDSPTSWIVNRDAESVSVPRAGLRAILAHIEALQSTVDARDASIEELSGAPAFDERPTYYAG